MFKFSLPIDEWGKNAVIFRVYNNSSKHTNNRIKSILILVENLADGLDDTIITAKMNILSILLSQERKSV